MRSLNHLICDNIIIDVFLRKISILVNFRNRASQLRRSLISLWIIWVACSMKNSKKKSLYQNQMNVTFREFFSMLRACLKISIEILFYQREFIWELTWFRTWRSQSTSDIRFSCTYLLSKSNILVFVTYWLKHDSWHNIWSSSWRTM